MGVRGLLTLLTDTSDDSLQWTTFEEYNDGNCPPLVLDASGFKMTSLESDMLVDAGLWQFGGGFQLACAELNRRLDALASIAPEIHIVFDGVPPVSKQTELDKRRDERMESDEAMAQMLAEGRGAALSRREAMSGCKAGSEGLGGVYEAFEERHRTRMSRTDPSQPFVTLHRPIQEGDPECARVAIACNGLILANDADFAILDSPRGFLVINHSTFHISHGRLAGLRASPQQLVAGLNTLLANLPGARYPTFRSTDLPLFAALGGCDQTKGWYDTELRGLLYRAWPCKHGDACRYKDTCWQSHDPAILAGYGCISVRCRGECGMAHTRVARQRLLCYDVEQGMQCRHYSCHFNTRDRRTADATYHILQGSQQRGKSAAKKKSVAVAKAALLASICTRNPPVFDGDLGRAVTDARDAYDLDFVGEHETIIRTLWLSHPDVWSLTRGCPRRSACSELMSWESNQHLTPYHPERDPRLPTNVNTIVQNINELAVRVSFFWNARLPPSRWSTLARPDLHLHKNHAFVWRNARRADPPLVMAIRDVATAHQCAWLPSLTVAQEEQRPYIAHVSPDDRVMAILLAAGMSRARADDFTMRLATWSVESHANLFEGLNVEPPEELIVALWLLSVHWSLSPSELAAFAEVIVCRDSDAIDNSRLHPGSALLQANGWHIDCLHEAADEMPYDAMPIDFGTAAFKRRADLIAQWKTAVSAVHAANTALDKPLLEHDASAAYRDGAIIHALICRGNVRCANPKHRACADQLIALVNPTRFTTLPSSTSGGEEEAVAVVQPAPASGGEEEPVASRAAPAASACAGMLNTRFDLATQIREQAVADYPPQQCPKWVVSAAPDGGEA